MFSSLSRSKDASSKSIVLMRSNGGGSSSSAASAAAAAATGDERPLLKRCKWLTLLGASIHVPVDGEAGYFEIRYADGKTNHLTAESSHQRDRWVRRLLQVLQKVSFAVALPPQPPRVGRAALQQIKRR